MKSDLAAAMQQGMALLNTGKCRQVAKHFQKLLKRHPRVADIQYFVGLALYRSGNCKKGGQYLEKLISCSPINPISVTTVGAAGNRSIRQGWSAGSIIMIIFHS